MKMKKLMLMLAIALVSLMFTSAKAQVHVGIGLHFGGYPVYAPAPVVVRQVPVYDEDDRCYRRDNEDEDDDDDHHHCHHNYSYNYYPSNDYSYNDYYYLPDAEAYYNVGRHCYYYNNGGAWVSATYLPGVYHNYSWRTARRYQIHAYRPYMHDVVYRERFGGYGGHHNWNNRNHGYGYYNSSRGHNQHFNNGRYQTRYASYRY